jgi:biopolymer transport protein ExbD
MKPSRSASLFKRDPHEDEVIVEINTTPLIDVMLVLLIMLIITIPIQTHSVKLNLPVGNPPPPVQKPQVNTVVVDAGGSTFWNGSAVSNEALANRLQAVVSEGNLAEVHLRPSKNAPYDQVAQVLSLAQRTGIKKLGLTGNEQFGD